MSTDSTSTAKPDQEPNNTPQSSLTHRASWVLFARLVSFAFAVVLPMLLTRRLSVPDFGLYKLVFTFINTASVMLPLGVSMSAYYFLGREREYRNATVLNILLFLMTVGGLGGATVSLFPGILTYIAGDSAIEPLATSIGVLMALWIVGTFLEVVPIANQEERLGSMMILGVSLSRTAMLVVAVLLFETVPSLILAAQLHTLIQVGVLLGYLVSRFPGFWRAFDRKILARQMAYALPFGVSGLLYTFQSDIHTYFVSHEFGPTSYAIYSVGCFQLPLVGMLSEAAASVLIPQISKLQLAGNTEQIIHLSLRAARKLSVVFVPMYGFLTVMGAEFLTVLFTDTYLVSLPIFRINLVMLLFSMIPTDPVVRAYAKYRYWMLTLMAVLAALLTVALIWVTPIYGMEGVITTVVVIRFLGRSTVGIAVSRLLGLRWSHAYLFGDIGKAIVAGMVAMGATAMFRLMILDWTPIIRLGAAGVVFVLVYGALLLLQRVPAKDEIEQLKRLLFKPLRLVRGSA